MGYRQRNSEYLPQPSTSIHIPDVRKEEVVSNGASSGLYSEDLVVDYLD
jgi:hypothetical protein